MKQHSALISDDAVISPMTSMCTALVDMQVNNTAVEQNSGSLTNSTAGKVGLIGIS